MRTARRGISTPTVLAFALFASSVALPPLASAHPIRILDAPGPLGAIGLGPPELAHGVSPSGTHPVPSLATTSSYSIEFACPEFPLDVEQYPCPIRIVDEDDLLGNPTVAISPLNPNNIVFSSLHGTLENGPTRRSRGEQTHTTFTHGGLPGGSVVLGGADWQDQPYSPPQGVDGGDPIVLGEDVHALVDPLGNLYIASVYSHGNGGNASDWGTSIAQWKFDPDLTLNYVIPTEVFEPRMAASIDAVWLHYLPGPGQVVLLWRETGARAADANGTLQAEGDASGGGNAWITGAITPADLVSPWAPLPASLTLGPCQRTTNPAQLLDKLYVGCVAGESFSIPGVLPDDIVVFEIDPLLGTTRALSKATLRGGEPMLAINAQGRMVLATVEATEEGVRAQLATSKLGEGWSKLHDFGNDLRNASGPPAGAWFNAILYRTATNTIHLIYTEEANATELASGLPTFRKALVILDPIGTVLVKLDLQVSDKNEVFTGGFREAPASDDAYADIRDSLIEFQGKEYMLFTDWAVFVFAEIVEHDEREDAIVLQQTPPVPEPLPAVDVALNTVNVGAGVVAGAVSAEAMRRLLAARHANLYGQGRGNR